MPAAYREAGALASRAVPEPSKNLIHTGTVDTAARHLARTCPDFDARRFRRLGSEGLDALEFKARAQHLCDALEATLPADFDSNCDAIEAALAPVRGNEALAKLYVRDDGLSGWAVRPFIEHHPALTFKTLTRWARDPSEHVRRLVSEGSRPRLPWGLQLKGLIVDPSPTLPLLERLQDDPSEYVRRSVANHLNDIAKDHPALVAAWLERHLPDAPAPRRALLRHASRTLIKRGDRRVLEAWGLGRPFAGEVVLKISPRRIALGEGVTLALTLRSRAKRAQTLVIDYAVHHVKANGGTSPKVFKGWSVTLAPGQTRGLEKRHAVKPITTRTYHAGRYAVDVRINGKICAEGYFALEI